MESTLGRSETIAGLAAALTILPGVTVTVPADHPDAALLAEAAKLRFHDRAVVYADNILVGLRRSEPAGCPDILAAEAAYEAAERALEASEIAMASMTASTPAGFLVKLFRVWEANCGDVVYQPDGSYRLPSLDSQANFTDRLFLSAMYDMLGKGVAQ